MQYYSCDVNQFLNYLEKYFESRSFNAHLTFVKPFEDFNEALR